jgi:glycosyltransferase involved in cell wall biosynthesis
MTALVELDPQRDAKVRGDGWKWLVRWTPRCLYELLGFGYNLYAYRRLSRAIRSRRPDLLYERYSLNTVAGIWASRRFRLPLVLEVNAPFFQEQDQAGNLTFRRLGRFCERWTCAHSSVTIVVSQVLKDLLVREGVPAEHMVVMPNGIDPRKFHPGISGEAVRRRYGLEGAVVLGFAGWFRHWHKLEMLLEVFREQQLDARGARLLLIGDGEGALALRRYVEQHGLQRAVILTGPVPRRDIAEHVAALDLAVQPSATDYSCPVKIIEYLAMAKPVLAPDQPNMRELLQHERTALLFAPGDRAQLGAALLRLVSDPPLRRRLGGAGYRELLGRRLLWSANAARTLALLAPPAAQPAPASQATPSHRSARGLAAERGQNSVLGGAYR